jgi:competence protein ComFC
MWNQLKENIIDILFPKICAGCGKEGNYICEECSLFLSEATSIFARGNLREVVGVWEYEGLIREIIFKIKYEGIFDAVGELGEKAFERREPYIPEGMAITFVPMSKKKEKRRGFNQAELIARKLGEITGREVLSLLEKIKDTPSQTALDKEGRIKNVRNSFCLKKGINCPKSILIVDDVWTSGATMEECARVLRKSGAKDIRGFVLARTI